MTDKKLYNSYQKLEWPPKITEYVPIDIPKPISEPMTKEEPMQERMPKEVPMQEPMAKEEHMQERMPKENINVEEPIKFNEEELSIKSSKYFQSNQKKRTFNSQVIMTTYFCSKQSHRKGITVENNDFSYISNWYLSVLNNNLYGIIFYDNLSKNFVEKYENDNIKFVKVLSESILGYFNDERFKIYYDFLLMHPEIKDVFMTDGNDVIVASSPFKNKLSENYVYCGSEDYPIKDFIKKILRQIEISDKNLFKLIEKTLMDNSKDFLNAGILGGNRQIILHILYEISKLLKKSIIHLNTNMAIFQYVILTYSKYITNKPVNSVFKKYEIHRKDVWFIHK